MEKTTTVVPFRQVDSVDDPLTEIAREGARRMLAVAMGVEADAFVAVSFTAFPLGSQLAFLVVGPVVDAKLAVLYGATFRRRFALQVLAIAVPATAQTVRLSIGKPASSKASHVTSSRSRCCGSSVCASRGDMPNASGSK